MDYEEKINDLLKSENNTNIELAISIVESLDLDTDLIPLFRGAKSLAEQIGGDWITYAYPYLSLDRKELKGRISFSEYGDSLKKVSCYHNPEVLELDFSGCCNLEKFSSMNNDLMENVILKGCTNINSLTCCRTKIKSFDLTDCSNLTYFWCFDNMLESLDLTNCSGLLELSCWQNFISHLDLSMCKKLEWLSLDKKHLATAKPFPVEVLVSKDAVDLKLVGDDIETCKFIKFV